MITSARSRQLDVIDDLTRRRFMTASSGAAIAGLLASCGADSDEESSGASGDGFPVTVAGALGTIELTERPERVVAIGVLRDTDIAVALGVIPVGATTAASLFPEGMTPWVAEKLGSQQRPQLLNDAATDFEAIAALRPDLILATDSYSLEQDYELLSKIAPALSYKTGIGADTWQSMAMHIAPALGRTHEAAKLVMSVEQQITEARKRNPEFEGKTFTAGPALSDGTIYTINSTEDAAVALYAQLGLVLSPKVIDLPASATPGRAQVSMEQIDVLDADVMILTFTSDTDRERFEAQPLFQALPAVQRGSYVAGTYDTSLAFAFPSVLSIPYGLAKTVPLIKQALAS